MADWKLLVATGLTGGILGAWLTAMALAAGRSYVDQRMRKMVIYWRDRAIRAEYPGVRRQR